MKKNKRIDVENEIFKKENEEYKTQKRQAQVEILTTNINKLKDKAQSVKDKTIKIFSGEKKKNKKVENAPKGILTELADELAVAMKKARSKNELFQLAQLMHKQSKEIQEIARRL